MSERVTWQKAERIAGKRLDRRRSYGKVGRDLCVAISWTQSCSGCCELGDYGSGSEFYPTHPKHRCLIGAGCHECGYHGVVRNGMWIPLRMWEVGQEVDRECAEIERRRAA